MGRFVFFPLDFWGKCANLIKMSAKFGRVIVLEGVDGTGKTTQFELLRDMGIEADFIRCPGGTKNADEIRQKLKEGQYKTKEEQFAAMNEALLDVSQSRIIPKLYRSTDIILDRFYPSMYAYQGAFINKKDVDFKLFPIPDYIFYFDKQFRTNSEDEFEKTINLTKIKSNYNYFFKKCNRLTKVVKISDHSKQHNWEKEKIKNLICSFLRYDYNKG